MENRLDILVGLISAKTAFQETLDFCKKDGVDCQKIYKFALRNDTESGMCFFFKQKNDKISYNFVKYIFKDSYLIRPLSDFEDEGMCSIGKCIEVTTKRVEWLESKIKELEAMG